MDRLPDCASRTWATATTSRARWPCWGRWRAWTWRWHPRRGYTLEEGLALAPSASGTLTLHTDPLEAVAGACAIYTDVWVSMGDEATAEERRAALSDYRIDDALLDAGAPGAFAMHDLPAHAGEEITAEGSNTAHASTSGSGGEPPARTEGAAGAASQMSELIPSLPSSPAEAQDDRISPRPQLGDELELRIESLAFGGEGVARLGGGRYVVFVAGAIPGDLVRAVVHKRKRSYAHARTLEVLEPGPERIAPVADHPGVPWQVIPYERQLEIKAEQVEEALRRIGHLDGFEMEEMVPAVERWRYRNKLEYSFGNSIEDWGLVCGFRMRRRAATVWRRWATACWHPSSATARERQPSAGAGRKASAPGTEAGPENGPRAMRRAAARGRPEAWGPGAIAASERPPGRMAARAAAEPCRS